MKRLFTPVWAGLWALMLLSGCAFSIGGGHSSKAPPPTVGQQLIDLKHARDAGAITEPEYRAEKARILQEK